MGKLVMGEGSKKGNSACHVEFKTGMKTQCIPGTVAFMSQKMPSQRPPELGCVGGGRSQVSVKEAEAGWESSGFLPLPAGGGGSALQQMSFFSLSLSLS